MTSEEEKNCVISQINSFFVTLSLYVNNRSANLGNRKKVLFSVAWSLRGGGG